MQQDTVEGMHDSHQVCGLQQGWQSSWVLVFIVKYVWSTADKEWEKMQVRVFLLFFSASLDLLTFQTVSSTPFQTVVHIVVIWCGAQSSRYNLADQTQLPDKVLSTRADLI